MPSRDDPDFRELPPAPSLAATVAAVWSRGAAPGGAGGAAHRVLPDGSADVIVAFEPAGHDRRGPLVLSGAWVVGTMTTAHVVPPGAAAIYVGVRLRPGRAGAVLGTPAHALADARLPLDALWPDAAATLRGLERVDDLPAARAGLAAALAPRLRGAECPPPALRRAVQLLEASGGRLRVDALGDALGVTRQHLARLFAGHVGLTPKTLARVLRLRAVLADARRADGRRADGRRAVARAAGVAPPAWSALAAAHGFADQAHLVDEVRALAGLTPTAWWGEQHPVPFRQDGAPRGG